MASCDRTVVELHGEPTELEASFVGRYADACTLDEGHEDRHLFPARDGSGRTLRVSDGGLLFVFPA